MKIIKRINTSAAVALDSSGREVVVFGKGIGFPQTPYELDDISKIERTFYDVDTKYLNLIADLPQETVLAAADITVLAEIVLKCQLNPNLPFTLADHLNFASTRLQNGVDLTTPIAYDIRHLYPKEIALGERALQTMKRYTGVELPAYEAVNIALHLITAEVEGGDMHSLVQSIKIIEDIDAIVERSLNITVDKDSYDYARFTMHLRYLIQALANKQQIEERGTHLLRVIAREDPAAYACTGEIVRYFSSQWKWHCNDEERLYLLLHVQRLLQKSSRHGDDQSGATTD